MVETKNQKLIKNMVLIGIGTVFTKCISFIMVPLYTNWLSPTQYGVFDLLASYVLLCVPFVTLQLEQAIFRFSTDSHEKGVYYYCGSLYVIGITSLCVGLVAVIVLCAVGYLEYALSFILYFLMLSLYNIAAEYLRGTNHLSAYTLHNIIVGVLTACFSVFFVCLLKFGVNGLLIAFALGYGISMLSIVIRFRLVGRIHNAKDEIKNDIRRMLKYSFPLIPNAVSWWIANVSNRTIIRMIMGAHYNGLFAVGSKIPTLLSVVYSVFNLSFQDVAIQTLHDDDCKEYYNNMAQLVVKALFTGGMVIVSITPILYSFLNVEYWASIYTVPMLLCGAIFLSIAQFMGDILLAQKRTQSIGTSTMIAAVVNIALNILLISWFGIIGASVATAVSYIVMFELRTQKIKMYIDMVALHKTLFVLMGTYMIISFITLRWAEKFIYALIVFAITVLVFMYVNRSLIRGILNKIIRRA